MGAIGDIKAKLLLEGKRCNNCLSELCSFKSNGVCKEWKPRNSGFDTTNYRMKKSYKVSYE